MLVQALPQKPARSNDLALPLLLAAMDGCWIYAVAWLLSATLLSNIDFLPVPAPLLLGACEFAAWGLASALQARTRLPVRAVQVLVGIVGLPVSVAAGAFTIASVMGLSSDWLSVGAYGIVVSLLLWALGVYRSAENLDFNAAYWAFRIAVVLLGTVVLLTALLYDAGGDFLWLELGGTVLWFFAWALAALAAGNRAVVQGQFGRTSMGRSGFFVLLASVGGVLVVGSFAGLFGGQNLLSTFEKLIRGMLALVGTGLYSIFYFVSLVVVQLASLVGLGPGLASFRDLLESNPPTNMSPQVQAISTGVAAVLLAVAAVWLAGRQLRNPRRKRTRLDGDIEREDLGSLELLQRQSSGWLKRLTSRLRPAARVDYLDDLGALLGKPEWSGTVSIRRIYGRLEAAASRMGHPRKPGQTPLEYQSVLASAISEHRPEITEITSAYVQSRYSARPASEGAARSVAEAWKRLEPSMKQATKAR
ncbi:MAG: DUF4129 domain-containing protein [Chloroflexota bacterium]|nr:DUF4129 domain-containing protein [Chloroflexota bacterium]